MSASAERSTERLCIRRVGPACSGRYVPRLRQRSPWIFAFGTQADDGSEGWRLSIVDRRLLLLVGLLRLLLVGLLLLLLVGLLRLLRLLLVGLRRLLLVGLLLLLIARRRPAWLRWPTWLRLHARRRRLRPGDRWHGNDGAEVLGVGSVAWSAEGAPHGALQRGSNVSGNL